MSNVSCQACEELRQDAPNFLVNGVTDAVCRSLQNNTGLASGNGNNNYADMTNALDCLIGNMVSTLKSFDVCDWQSFMEKFIPNNYEILKALLCDMKGQWSEIDTINGFLDSICPSIDNIFNLIRGNKPPYHDGYWFPEFVAKCYANYSSNGNEVYGDQAPSVDNFKPSFQCDILEGAGCEKSRRLGRYYVGWHRLIQHSPYVWSWGVTELIGVGTVIGLVPWSAIDGDGMALSTWKSLLRTTGIWQWGMMSQGHLCNVSVSGYCNIDGVIHNPQYEQYGENTMVIRWGPIVGGDIASGINGSILSAVKSYNA